MIVSGNMFYPMKADIYYAKSIQDDLGAMVKTWRYDRTIECSAIKERAEYNAKNSVNSQKFLSYTTKINFRTPKNLCISSENTIYRPTDVLISHIKDPIGNLVWIEDMNYDTTFEIESYEPMFDENHVLGGYRALLSRSDEQVENRVD